MKKIALFLALIMAFMLAGCGSEKTVYIGSPIYSVSGKVVSRGGAGVGGVDLIIGGDTVATTDSEGKFTLSGLEGTKTLTAQKEGYTLLPERINLSYARSDADFNATLIESDVPDPPDPPVPPVDGKYPIAPYEKIAAPEYSSSYALYDTFDEGVQPDGNWEIGNGSWSNPAFKGAYPHNVEYTADGVLLLRSKGDLHPDPNKRMTGSVIVSKERFGPGVYDLSMKAAPRLGVCTAVWPIYNDGKSNHEVDIEFPGHPNNGEDRGLDYMMSTTWTTESNYRTNQVDLIGKGLSPANDGKWHRYTIDWKTTDVDSAANNGAASEDKIDWYVDGVLVSTVTGGTVARIAGQLWLGTWMPRGWAGPSNYENADMQLDWVTVKPYILKDSADLGDDANNTKLTTTAKDAYPVAPVAPVEYNWISNGDFSGNKSAWQRGEQNDKGSHEVFLDYLGKTTAFRFKNNATISQKVDAAYAGYTFALKADYVEHTPGSTLTVKAEFIDNFGSVKGEYIYDPELDENILVVPDGAKNIKITVTSSGTGVIDLKGIELFRTWAEAEVDA